MVSFLFLLLWNMYSTYFQYLSTACGCRLVVFIFFTRFQLYRRDWKKRLNYITAWFGRLIQSEMTLTEINPQLIHPIKYFLQKLLFSTAETFNWAWKLDEWLRFSVFAHFYFTDLYDAFIESNKKEDAAERMWSIRSVVSVFVCMQVCSYRWKSVLYRDNKGNDLSSCFYSDKMLPSKVLFQ